MRTPNDVDSDARGKESCDTVSRVFKNRPWVIDLRETVQNDSEDEDGYDMFVHVNSSFQKAVRMRGRWKELPVQIKSSYRRIKSFVRKYSKQARFFNVTEKRHQFVLCGMYEEDLILADIVGQIVAHMIGYGMTERDALNCLNSFGDKLAVDAYRRNKEKLLNFWYGSHLIPSK
ncbi:TPA: hypothetical protein DIU27_00915 [Candidatus Collierbacteria bacterium]|uniref:Uncharacterized protein n=1 Tax=Candidatus Collierbacteria bacterium GW2011_GWB2_44_22 TaxID=1618387 RepID=A0A0G1HXL1_9BACT|nr:MAG: hypothetical protein UW31_C0010G0044 [Candidatus Collierbacteria bacterium GW2011_GWA2_44_13]KKT51670.1 MAG: hypothetical protein UW44_C0009G0034 [Candidatus Collierbacteria bacterium GW2011_GWB2_44_22]KKT62598.1 MAG: hypothetical protein UW56_C0005G0034 [Candidatus Collierbacteria bacterium GW2011_GWD1_44_27]KKT66026.1 MAG: hypothetical protein UW58_C0014G0013 [Candidatus Collierbacteria bacterium GW2011_GWC2_44_30]KKT68526.1 MAG: hypothetical protein UW64_C0017G0036 [Microgenomates gr